MIQVLVKVKIKVKAFTKEILELATQLDFQETLPWLGGVATFLTPVEQMVGRRGQVAIVSINMDFKRN